MLIKIEVSENTVKIYKKVKRIKYPSYDIFGRSNKSLFKSQRSCFFP